MIEKVSRKEIFARFPLLKNFIFDLQESDYNEKVEDGYFDDWLKENQDAYDLLQEEVASPDSRFFKLEIESADLRTFTKEFSKSLLKLFQETQTEKIILLSDLRQNLFGWQEHPYYKVKKAYKHLEEILATQEFTETLVFDVKEVPKIFEIFFWLERCDPAIPEFIFWFDSKERYCFTLCKYGNIHVSEFTYRKTLKENILKDCGFTKFKGRCREIFSESGAIQGRMIEV